MLSRSKFGEIILFTRKNLTYKIVFCSVGYNSFFAYFNLHLAGYLMLDWLTESNEGSLGLSKGKLDAWAWKSIALKIVSWNTKESQSQVMPKHHICQTSFCISALFYNHYSCAYFGRVDTHVALWCSKPSSFVLCILFCPEDIDVCSFIPWCPGNFPLPRQLVRTCLTLEGNNRWLKSVSLKPFLLDTNNNRDFKIVVLRLVYLGSIVKSNFVYFEISTLNH